MPPSRSRYYTFIKPIINNKAVRNYSFITFSIIVSIIFIVFAIQPTVKTIISLQKGIAEQKTVLKAAKAKSEALGEGKSNYNKIPKEAKENLDSLIPNYPTLPQFIADISALVENKEATISGLQFQPTTLPIKSPQASSSGQALEGMDFTLNIQGTYTTLLTVLDQLSNFNHYITIQTISMNKPAEGSVIMSITGKTYYLKN